MSAAAVRTTSRPQEIETLDPAWRNLYRIAGWAAVVTAIFLPVQVAVFIIWPPPAFEPTLDNTLSWFAFFNANKLLGLLDLDILIIVDMVLGIPIMLALYAALRRVDQSLALVAAALGLMGTAAYFASSPTLAMLSLSGQYAAAITEAQRSAVVAAGQVLLANYQGTPFHIFYTLGSLTPILFSVVMLRGHLFSRWIAWIGIVANVIALGLYIPVVGVYISVFSVLLLWAYYILIARRFLTA